MIALGLPSFGEGRSERRAYFTFDGESHEQKSSCTIEESEKKNNKFYANGIERQK